MGAILRVGMNHYTRSCIYCHMVCHVIVIPSSMTILMNKFTSTRMDDSKLDGIHANYGIEA